MIHDVLQPEGWPRPKGYSNGVAARGRTVYTAGVIGWDADQVFRARDFPGQFRRVLGSTLAILAEAGAGPEHVARMTWYVTSRDQYLAHAAEMGAAWRELMGRSYPAMAVVEVAGLMEPDALLEIETIAVVPD